MPVSEYWNKIRSRAGAHSVGLLHWHDYLRLKLSVSDAAHANLQSAAEMVSRDAIDASGGDLASPGSDIAIA